MDMTKFANKLLGDVASAQAGIVSTIVSVTSPFSKHTYEAEFVIKKDGTVRLLSGPHQKELNPFGVWKNDDEKHIRGLLQQEALDIAFKYMQGEWPCEE